MTASLVFREVSAADLSELYTCKLESDSHPSAFVTISLAQAGTVRHIVAGYGAISSNTDFASHTNRICINRVGDPGSN